KARTRHVAQDRIPIFHYPRFMHNKTSRQRVFLSIDPITRILKCESEAGERQVHARPDNIVSDIQQVEETGVASKVHRQVRLFHGPPLREVHKFIVVLEHEGVETGDIFYPLQHTHVHKSEARGSHSKRLSLRLQERLELLIHSEFARVERHQITRAK